MSVISQVERSAMHHIVSWMKEIIKDENLPFQVEADIELRFFGKKKKFPDILLFTSYPNEVACLIEFKPPVPYDPYDPDIVDNAYNEANRAPGNLYGTCRYFGTWNLNRFVLWDKKQYSADSYLDMVCRPYEVAQARKLDDIKCAHVEESVKKFLKNFLKEFFDIYFDIKPVPALNIDEIFIYRIRTAIDSFFIPISEQIYKAAKSNTKIKRDLRRWFSEQGWLFQDQLDDYERTARQYTYLIVDKVLFYNALRIQEPGLDEIKIDKNVTANKFKKELQKYFDKALKIDYEPIFAENFLETLPLPDSIVPQMVSFIDSLNRKYNFSSIGYEIIGRVFERLIPEKERHQLGQYFTRSDVVDIINAFCIQSANDTVLDPGCGAATFLIRAYGLIKRKSRSKSHKELLRQLYGIDISKFAAHLSMINLTTRELSEKENYPCIINIDFFDVFPEKTIAKKYKIRKPSGGWAEVRVPYVDAVVGNPPYTRQEELESAFEERYKDKLISVIQKDFHITIGKRSGIYSYFFIHGSKFLKDGGRFGFVTPNSWLDADYGKYLQEFFLNTYKILAVIESKLERWFEDADINTCITILEKCKDKEERENNLVRFVQLKAPLNKLVPLASNEQDRWEGVNKFKEKILEKSDYFEDDEMRIYIKSQKDLFLEGYDEDEKIYQGSKWGKYIRAPEIYFKILKNGRDIFVPLKKIALVRRGFTTGANEFFYLNKSDLERLGIEREFWTHKAGQRILENFILVSPKQAAAICINEKDLNKRVLLIHKSKSDLKGMNILKYINIGEEKGFHSRPTCNSRDKWYELPKREPGKVLWQMIHFSRHIVIYNEPHAYVDHNLFELVKIDNPEIYCIILNSTIYALIKEINGRLNLGQGSLKNEGIDIKAMPIIPLNKFSKDQKQRLFCVFQRMKDRPIGSIFDEIGASKSDDVKLYKVKKDRLELDNIIFDILGLSKKERLEVYKAVVDLVKSRIEKAQSVKKRERRSNLNIEIFADNILEETQIKTLKKFPEDYLENVETVEKQLPEGNSAEIGNDLYNGIHVKIGSDIIKCASFEEAKFIRYAVLSGKRVVKIPENKEDLARIINEYDNLVTEIKTEACKLLKEEVQDKKLREKILWEIEKKIFKR